jgi:RNA polymerase sigma-70 factor (ECF subfamily)
LDPAARAEVASWVSEHWNPVFGLLYRMSGDREESEDLAQETFLRAAQRRETFAAGSNLRAWLLRIATNAFLDVRRRKQVARTEALPDDPPIDGDEPSPSQPAQNRELGEAIAAALLKLPETSRAVFLLRTREELSFREISEAIGATEETARWHMLQARRRLMSMMQGWL